MENNIDKTVRRNNFFDYIDNKILYETMMGKVAKANFDSTFNNNASNSYNNIPNFQIPDSLKMNNTSVLQTPGSSKMNNSSSVNSSNYMDSDYSLMHTPTFSKMKKKKLFYPSTIDENSYLSDGSTNLSHGENNLTDMARYPDGNITFTLKKVTNNSERRVIPAFGWKLMTNNQKTLKSGCI